MIPALRALPAMVRTAVLKSGCSQVRLFGFYDFFRLFAGNGRLIYPECGRAEPFATSAARLSKVVAGVWFSLRR